MVARRPQAMGLEHTGYLNIEILGSTEFVYPNPNKPSAFLKKYTGCFLTNRNRQTWELYYQ